MSKAVPQGKCACACAHVGGQARNNLRRLHCLSTPCPPSCSSFCGLTTTAAQFRFLIFLPPSRPRAAAAGQRPSPRGRTVLIGRLRCQQGHSRGKRLRRGRGAAPRHRWRRRRWWCRFQLRRPRVGGWLVPRRRGGGVPWRSGGGNHEDQLGGDQRLHGPRGTTVVRVCSLSRHVLYFYLRSFGFWGGSLGSKVCQSTP